MADKSENGVSYYNNYNTGVKNKVLEAAKKQVKDGTLNLDKAAKSIGTDVASFKDFISDDMTNLEKEMNPYLKSNLSGVDIDKDGNIVSDGSIKDRIIYTKDGNARLDVPVGDGSVVVAGCEIRRTRHGDNLVCHSDYLGDFQYDPDIYAIGYIEIPEDDGSKGQLPVLRYISDKSGIEGWFGNTFGMNGIPEGVKHLDYTFTDTGITSVPRIPSSVESMHYSFAGCTDLLGGNSSSWDIGIVLPDGLKDASGAFKGCSKLYPFSENPFKIYAESVGKSLFMGPLAAVSAATKGAGAVNKAMGNGSLVGVGEEKRWPSGLVNISEMFEGCDKIDGGADFVNQGGFSIEGLGEGHTPYLSASSAKDAFTHIKEDERINYDTGRSNYEEKHGEKFSDTAAGISYNIKNDGKSKYGEGKTKEGVAIDKDTISAAKAFSLMTNVGEKEVKPVMTNEELKSDGSMSNHWANDDKGWYNDTSAKRMGMPDTIAGAGLEKAGVVGLTGLGIFGATSLLTKNRLVGVLAGIGGTFILEQAGVLGGSFEPVLSFTAKLLPDCALKVALENLIEKLPSVKLKEQQDRIKEYNATWDDDHKVAAEWQADRMGKKGHFKDINQAVYYDNMADYMRENGKACAETLTLQATFAAGDEGMRPVSEVISIATKAMEAEWNDEASANGGRLSEETMKSMREYYVSVVSALEAYDGGAAAGIDKAFKRGSADYESSYAGLAMADKAYVDAMLDSINTMDKQYGFMDDATRQKISRADIYGVDMGLSIMDAVYDNEGRSVLSRAEEAVKAEKSEGTEKTEGRKDTDTGKVSVSESFAESEKEVSGDNGADMVADKNSDKVKMAEEELGEDVLGDSEDLEDPEDGY